MSYFETKARREAKQLHVNELNAKHRKAKITKPILNELTTSMQEVEKAIQQAILKMRIATGKLMYPMMSRSFLNSIRGHIYLT